MYVTTLPAKGRLTPASIAKLITTAPNGSRLHPTRHRRRRPTRPLPRRRQAHGVMDAEVPPTWPHPDGSRPPPSAFVIGDAALISPDDARAEAAALRAKIIEGRAPYASSSDKLSARRP